MYTFYAAQIQQSDTSLEGPDFITPGAEVKYTCIVNGDVGQLRMEWQLTLGDARPGVITTVSHGDGSRSHMSIENYRLIYYTFYKADLPSQT